MNIYELEKRFDSKTGEPIQPGWGLKEWRCDYCGDVIDSKRHKPYPFYQLDYAGSDGMWGALSGVEEEFNKARNYMISMNMFLSSDDREGGLYGVCMDCSHVAHVDYAEKVLRLKKSHDYPYRFADFLRECRTKAAQRLLEEGEIEEYQLAGYEGEWPE